MSTALKTLAYELLYICGVVQLEVLKQYLDSGGGLLVMLGEGGEMKYDTNINFLLEEFGIMVNNGECILFSMSSAHYRVINSTNISC